MWKRGCCHCDIETKYFIFIWPCQPSSDISGTSVESGLNLLGTWVFLHRAIVLGQKRLPVTFHLPHGDPLLTKNTLPWRSSPLPIDILCHLPFLFSLPFSFCQEGQCVSGLDVGQSRGKGHSQDPYLRSFPTCVRPAARDSRVNST